MQERKKIRRSIDDKQQFQSIITNYRKDGSIYKCSIEGYPIFNGQGNLVNYVALEKAV